MTQAAALLDQALEAEPDHLYALYNRAQLHLLHHEVDEAEALYGRALRREPAFIPAALGLAKALIGRRSFDRAREVLGAVEPHLEDTLAAEFHYLRGVCAMGEASLDLALEAFFEYARLRPDSTDPLLCLYRAHAQRGEQAQALVCLEQMTDRDPSQSAVWVTLLQGLLEKDEPERLLHHCRRMTEANPDRIELHNLAVRLCSESRQYARAYQLCRDAVARHPDYDRTQFLALARVEALV